MGILRLPPFVPSSRLLKQTCEQINYHYRMHPEENFVADLKQAPRKIWWIFDHIHKPDLLREVAISGHQLVEKQQYSIFREVLHQWLPQGVEDGDLSAAFASHNGDQLLACSFALQLQKSGHPVSDQLAMDIAVSLSVQASRNVVDNVHLGYAIVRIVDNYQISDKVMNRITLNLAQNTRTIYFANIVGSRCTLEKKTCQALIDGNLEAGDIDRSFDWFSKLADDTTDATIVDLIREHDADKVMSIINDNLLRHPEIQSALLVKYAQLGDTKGYDKIVKTLKAPLPRPVLGALLQGSLLRGNDDMAEPCLQAIYSMNDRPTSEEYGHIVGKLLRDDRIDESMKLLTGDNEKTKWGWAQMARHFINTPNHTLYRQSITHIMGLDENDSARIWFSEQVMNHVMKIEGGSKWNIFRAVCFQLDYPRDEQIHSDLLDRYGFKSDTLRAMSLPPLSRSRIQRRFKLVD